MAGLALHKDRASRPLPPPPVPPGAVTQRPSGTRHHPHSPRLGGSGDSQLAAASSHDVDSALTSATLGGDQTPWNVLSQEEAEPPIAGGIPAGAR